ncbi:MAG TPA: HEAT repeat domain-containing protein [Planctomycetota bacterium]|nr:HEAT repeat domain-containing protein [Planctomycetota bacterium]
MERGLLSDAKLAKSYGDVVWMYLFQDFSKSEQDRAAERVAIRFGISSWPQHFLVDPFTLKTLADTGRSLDSFTAAVERTNVEKSEPTPSVADFVAFDALARSLEKDASLALAQKHLQHEDIVVSYRAVEIAAKKAPAVLVKASAALLTSPNDQIRYAVCDALASEGDPGSPEPLHAMLRDPGASRNPNVLRIHAVKALARCGDALSLAAIEPFATSGAWRNGLTRVSIDSIVAICGREAKARRQAIEILAKAYPAPPAPEEAAEQKPCESLAKDVHSALEKLSGKRVAFPHDYTPSKRDELMKAW